MKNKIETILKACVQGTDLWYLIHKPDSVCDVTISRHSKPVYIADVLDYCFCWRDASLPDFQISKSRVDGLIRLARFSFTKALLIVNFNGEIYTCYPADWVADLHTSKSGDKEYYRIPWSCLISLVAQKAETRAVKDT